MNMKHERGRYFYYVRIPRNLRIIGLFEFALLGGVELFASIYNGGRWWSHATTDHKPYDAKNILILTFGTLFFAFAGLIEVNNQLSGKHETVIISPFRYFAYISILIMFAVAMPFIVWKAIRS